MAYEATQTVNISITYGHDGECVIMQFSQMAPHHRMTVRQTQEMIDSLEEALEKLAEDKKRKPN